MQQKKIGNKIVTSEQKNIDLVFLVSFPKYKFQLHKPAIGGSQNLLISDPMFLSHIERDIIAFGRTVKRLDLATVVIDLYDSALQESSRMQYRTGQRAYMRFVNGIDLPGYLLPFPRTKLKKTELTLAFFMASLLLKPSIKRAATILGYETHVK